MKNSFQGGVLQEVQEALDSGESVHEIKIDLRLSMIKPLHANWSITVHSILKHKRALPQEDWNPDWNPCQLC